MVKITEVVDYFPFVIMVDGKFLGKNEMEKIDFVDFGYKRWDRLPNNKWKVTKRFKVRE